MTENEPVDAIDEAVVQGGQTPTNRRHLLVGAILVVVVGGGAAAVLYARSNKPKLLTAEATVTYLDATTHKATFECIHPRNKTVVEFTTTVGADCKILVNGSAADFSAIRVGDRLWGTGLWDRSNHSVTMRKIAITRKPGADGN